MNAHLLASTVPSYQQHPPRVLMLGTGVFLRGYFAWMVDHLNERCGWNGSIVAVKATASGSLAAFEEQQGAFTHCLRGLREGVPIDERRVITSVQGWCNPLVDWAGFLATAEQESIEFVVSNMTEAGLAYTPCARTDQCPETVPARLTAWLYARFLVFSGKRPVTVLPFELVPDNGKKLLEIVTRHACDWNLSSEFLAWLERDVVFCSTLVDRIVAAPSGAERAAMMTELGYRDDLLNASEPYLFLAVTGPDDLLKRLPLRDAGFDVVQTEDLTPYQERKVRILNAAHCVLTFFGLLLGHETVREAIEDEELRDFLVGFLTEDVVPTLSLPPDALHAYIATTLDRFRNPALRHLLESIGLSAHAKVIARLVPTLRARVQATGRVPWRLAATLGAYLEFDRARKGEAGWSSESDDVAGPLSRLVSLGEDQGALNAAVTSAVVTLRGASPRALLTRWETGS